MRIKLGCLGFICAAALLFGCSSHNLKHQDFDALSQNERIALLENIKNLKEYGKVALFISQPRFRISSDFMYDYEKDNSTLEIIGPVGVTMAKIYINNLGEMTVLIDSKKYTHHEAEAILKKQFNLTLPADKLSRIIRGLNVGTPTYDEQGYLKSVTTGDDYIINYKSYDKFQYGYNLPKEIEITKDNSRLLIKINRVILY